MIVGERSAGVLQIKPYQFTRVGRVNLHADLRGFIFRRPRREGGEDLRGRASTSDNAECVVSAGAAASIMISLRV